MLRKLAVVLGMLGAATAAAQSSELAAGDSAYREHRGEDALVHYEAAINDGATKFVALCKASRIEVDLAESGITPAMEDLLLGVARTHAEQAIALDPKSADGHFALARALGRKALSVGTLERIKYSKIIRAEADSALAIDSLHAGALHVLGMWHAEVLRVNGFARLMAQAFLGGELFGEAKWEEAQRLLERAAQLEPDRIVHKLDLAGVYAQRGDKAKARELYAWIATAKLTDYNDVIYKRLAAERAQRL